MNERRIATIAHFPVGRQQRHPDPRERQAFRPQILEHAGQREADIVAGVDQGLLEAVGAPGKGLGEAAGQTLEPGRIVLAAA